ncbi:coq1 putative hexaprenyl diphosphate synthase [Coelomomyces lativittatus]|nr:coq1 putative hexaprenyl diphosphate synthase [Coelomomyces lativittatus]KAJ1510678.1 coq1 putative hexaprenyl diphosphate synthase [Coelomomyces lativittatus]KAJ1518528.1 coq1 putative hexaprenyl diphosphate synthase [Coelomomyces lativittatus]
MNSLIILQAYPYRHTLLSKPLMLLYASRPTRYTSSIAIRTLSTTPLPLQNSTNSRPSSQEPVTSNLNEKKDGSQSPVAPSSYSLSSHIYTKTKSFLSPVFQWLWYPTQSINKYKISNKLFMNSDVSLKGSSATWTQTLVQAADLVGLNEQRGVYHVASQIQHLVSNDHPLLDQIAKYYFTQPGKQLRPLIVLLISQATCNREEGPTILDSQRRLAEITELIHTASLLHDDVIDNADLRRNIASVNALHGNKLAVLAGDFLLARASVALAHLRQLEVIELLSTVLADLVQGEILQMQSSSGTHALDSYLDRIYKKTASLIAKSSRAAAVLGEVSQEVAQNAYVYGKHLGIAFQLMDDVLDLSTTSTAQLGKPVHADIHEGVITAPMLFAMEHSSDFRTLVQRKFQMPGDEKQAIDLLHRSDAFEKTKKLAEQHCLLAVDAIKSWTPSQAKTLLENLASSVLYRTK